MQLDDCEKYLSQISKFIFSACTRIISSVADVINFTSLLVNWWGSTFTILTKCTFLNWDATGWLSNEPQSRRMPRRPATDPNIQYWFLRISCNRFPRISWNWLITFLKQLNFVFFPILYFIILAIIVCLMEMALISASSLLRVISDQPFSPTTTFHPDNHFKY